MSSLGKKKYPPKGMGAEPQLPRKGRNGVKQWGGGGVPSRHNDPSLQSPEPFSLGRKTNPSFSIFQGKGGTFTILATFEISQG